MNALGVRKWESRFYGDSLLTIRNEVCNTAYALLRIHEQNSLFKYTKMGQMIPKEMK